MYTSDNKSKVNVGRVLLSCVIVLAQLALLAYLFASRTRMFAAYLLVGGGFFAWIWILKNSYIPDWLLGISGTLQMLMGSLVLYTFIKNITLAYYAGFGSVLISFLGMFVGLAACIWSFVIVRECKTYVGFAISSLLCFVVAGIFAFCPVMHSGYAWHQLPALLIIIIGLYWAAFVPGSRMPFWLLLTETILSIIPFLYAMYLDKGPLVGICICNSLFGGGLSLALFLGAPRTTEISGSTTSKVFKRIGAGVLSLIGLVCTVFPFVVIFF